VVFATGAGCLPHWCGVCESLFQIVSHMERPPLVVTAGENTLAGKLRDRGLPVISIPFPVELVKNLRARPAGEKARFARAAAGYAARFVSLLRRRRAKLVYLSDVVTMLVASLPSKAMGVKTVMAVRGEPGAGLHWQLNYLTSDSVAPLSHEMKQRVVNCCRPSIRSRVSMKTTVIYNGVDLASVEARAAGHERVRSSLGIGGEETLILYVGAFVPGKGQLDFITGPLARLFEGRGRAGKVRVAFIGGAKSDAELDYERQCRRAARESSFADKVHFAGFQENVWPWYAASNLVALASNAEGMPRTVIEAMACAKPVVSYDVCSVTELLAGTGAGVVVAPIGNGAAMAKELAALAGDESRRSEMGARGLAFARDKLDINRVAKAHEELFDGLIGRER